MAHHPGATGSADRLDFASGRAGPWPRIQRAIFGRPRDPSDRSIFHRLSLVPFLAWVGLGADGLSSSCYGPEEAFRTLGGHTYLAVLLAIATAATVVVISRAYSRIIEEFPHGGGGYVVASKLLGERAGVVSGAALLVDYVLTITISIAAAADALYSVLPLDPASKPFVEAVLIVVLVVLNIRGVRESVLVLLPIFLVFLLTHALLIAGGIAAKVPQAAAVAGDTVRGFREGASTLGIWGMLLVLLHAYSLGGGTYTGIEAVSNGLPIMREPRVETAKRTMVYMAASLAFTAGGLLACYLLWDMSHVPGKTLNAALAERVAGGLPAGGTIVLVTLLSEGALLVVAAQAGFIDGPRVLANMAIDSWVPQRFAALSERLTTRNGIVLMGTAALGALAYTGGNVRRLVVMYSINVFLTFSLSTFAMLRSWVRAPRTRPSRRKRISLFASAFALCATILAITVVEKLPEGGWLTLCVTGAVVAACFVIRGHYRGIARRLGTMYAALEDVPAETRAAPGPVDPARRTAAVLVGAYGGLGIHTVLHALRLFPGDFENLVFVSVGVIDSGSFKGETDLDALRERTREMLERYAALAGRLGIAAACRFAVGADVVAEAEKACLDVSREFPRTTFFIGKVVFGRESWYHRLLHNGTALAVQRRLELAGKPLVIIPARVA